MAAPIPSLMGYQPLPRPGRALPPPRNPNIGTRPIPGGGLLASWECDTCHATGRGRADDGFAHEEAEHCLTGCNGSLRNSGADRDSAPALPDADLSLNGLPLAK